MNCSNCINYLSLTEHKGINEVHMDGVCTQGGIDQPETWKAVTNPGSNTCMNHKPKHQGLKIKPCAERILDKVRQIADPATMAVSKHAQEIKCRQVQGECGNCSNWKRTGFSNNGECWKQGVMAHSLCADSHTCTDFYARPDNKGQAGDIVTITVGDKWKVLFVGQKHVLCVDQQGNEKVFDKNGLRFDKC